MTMRFAWAAAVLVALAGCATTDTRVVLRELGQPSVRVGQPLAKVAVVTIDGDAARRKLWDEAFVKRLGASGVQATTRAGLPGLSDLDAGAVTVDGAAIIDAARRAGADGVLFVQPPSEKPIGSGAYRWWDARSDPNPRSDLNTTPAAVTEVRLYGLSSTKESWRALVSVYYPAKDAAEAPVVAGSVVEGLVKRGFLRAGVR